MLFRNIILTVSIIGLLLVNQRANCQINSPNQFDTTNVAFWFIADSISAADGDKVSEWYSYTNNIFASQTSDDRKPILSAGIQELNNHNALYFDGINDNFLLSSDVSIQSLYIIVNWDGVQTTFPDFKGVINKSSFDHVPYYLVLGNKAGSTFYTGGGTFFEDSIFVNGGENLFSPLLQYKLITGFTSNVENFAQLQIGGAANNSSRFWKGNIAEIIGITEKPEKSFRDSLNLYLQNKYAPPLDLPDTIKTTTFCDTSVSAFQNYYVDYLWSTGSTDSAIIIENPGKYSVTSTDFMGNESYDSVYVQFPKVNTPNSLLFCYGDSLLWNTELSSSFTFSWLGSLKTDSAIYISQPGDYNVTITDTEGCTYSTTTLDIQIDSFPTKNSFGSDRSICSGEPISLDQQSTEITNYLWNTGETTQSINIDTAGQYFLTVTNANGCMDKDSISIDIKGVAPAVDFLYDTACFGSPTSFFNTTIIETPDNTDSLQWSFSNNYTSTIQNPEYTFPTPDTLAVTLEVFTDSGCFNQITKEVFTKPSPNADFSVLYGNTQCVGQTVLFQNLSDTSDIEAGYIWNFGDGTESGEPSPEHVFSYPEVFNVTHAVTLSNECSDTIIRAVSVDDVLPQPGSIQLTNPKPDADFFHPDSTVLFEWQADVNAYLYDFQVSDVVDFQTTLVDTQLQITQFMYNLPDTGYYYWRVRGVNLCNTSNDFTTDSLHYLQLNTSHLALWIDASYHKDFSTG
jgi:hypothetical protein